jgi:hypothetical protein
MDPIVSHLLTYLGGVATGAAGQYFADKYTDLRRKNEEKDVALEGLREAESKMPELFKELRSDLIFSYSVSLSYWTRA